MTGAYLRVERDGKWINVEVEDLTATERHIALGEKSAAELMNWIDMLCKVIKELDDDRQWCGEEEEVT